MVHLQSTLQSGKLDKSAEKSECGTTAEQCADIQNDFFAVQFLTPFPQPGLYNLNMEAKLIDPEGNRYSFIYYVTMPPPRFNNSND